MLIFGATINVVPWVYGPEILPLEARTRGTAISVSAHWLWYGTSVSSPKLSQANATCRNFFIVMITPVLINRIGWKTYIIFMCTNLVFVPIIWKFYPETSNLSLEEIDGLFLPESMQSYARRWSVEGGAGEDAMSSKEHPDNQVDEKKEDV